MDQKSFPIIVVLVAIASFLAGVTVTKNSTPAVEGAKVSTSSPTSVPPTQAQNPTIALSDIKALFTKGHVAFGDANKKVLFVEISDPSCPYCQVAAGKNPTLNVQINPNFKLVSDGGTYVAPVVEMKKLVDQGKAGYVWIYYPGHGNGEMGAKALYCANDEGKFWQVHDKIMSSDGYNLMNGQVLNDKTKAPLLISFLQSVISSQKFKDCLSGSQYDTRLQQDSSSALAFGIQGTPMFIVNTTVFPGAYSYTDMSPVVNSLLQ